MSSAVRSRGRRRSRSTGLRARPGIALFVAMFMVVAIGALALSAIYLTANATLISKTYEREDDLKYAAEAALSIGKAKLNFDPTALPDTSYIELLQGQTLSAADGQPIRGMTVNLYVGPTGSTTGQFGTFASLVSEARDNNGTGFVRRLELTQESFAKFAYWSNTEGGAIYFANNDQLWGPVWSNDDLNIAASHATFFDEVGTAGVINGVANGTYAKGYQIHLRRIALPTLTKLAKLSTLATAGGFNFTAPTTGNAGTVRMRIEFVAVDMNLNGDSTEANEGFLRVYTANAGQEAWLRGDFGGNFASVPLAPNVLNCGDWHPVVPGGPSKFFPFAVHVHATLASPGVYANTWYDTVVAGGMAGGVTTANVNTAHAEGDSVRTSANFSKILQHAGARCFPGGDPHLVAVARTTAAGAGHDTDANVHKGGDDTTFTAVDQFGTWSQFTASPNAAIVLRRPADARNLYPLYRGFNSGTKGVIYSSGTVGVSGVLRGEVTLYTPNTIVVLDDLRYANDPAAGHCVDILGLISGQNTVIADNGVNSPQWVKIGGSPIIRSFDDTPDLYLHAVVMALGTFNVENYLTGPTSAAPCLGTPWGRGCLFLTGGVIQNTRGPVATSSGTGYLKQYSYDRCAATHPPPYFPTTGRFQDNRYYELDPVRFNVAGLFKSLSTAP